MGRKFRNGFKEEGKLELCLGRESEICQVEKRDGRQSLKGGRRLGKTWPFQGVMTCSRKWRTWEWRDRQESNYEEPFMSY